MIIMSDSAIPAEGKRRGGRPKVRGNDYMNNGMKRHVLEIGGYKLTIQLDGWESWEESKAYLGM
jgi:hypothetical protein